MRFELHCHSTFSDGSDPPDEVAARAASRGVEIFALTDHDSCDGCDVTVATARTLRAVELSCDYQGTTIHVLAYDRGRGGWDGVTSRLAAQRTARANRLRVMAAKLERRGVRIDLEPLIAESARRSVGRPDLARAMVACGAATSIKDAFARHLFDGGPVDVPHHALPIADAIAVGREAGAALSLAHPHLYGDRAYALLRQFRGAGLDGVEAMYGAYDARERARWLTAAGDLGLVATAGSDWHGSARTDVGADLGVDVDAQRSDALIGWLGL